MASTTRAIDYYSARSCRSLWLDRTVQYLSSSNVNEVNLVEYVLRGRLTNIASSPSAARRIHEAAISILDRIAQGRYGSEIFAELAGLEVFARYQAERKQIDKCLADIVADVVRMLAELIRSGDPSVKRVARRARLVFDSLIVGVRPR